MPLRADGCAEEDDVLREREVEYLHGAHCATSVIKNPRSVFHDMDAEAFAEKALGHSEPLRDRPVHGFHNGLARDGVHRLRGEDWLCRPRSGYKQGYE